METERTDIGIQSRDRVFSVIRGSEIKLDGEDSDHARRRILVFTSVHRGVRHRRQEKRK